MRPLTDRDGESGQELFNGMYKSARVIVEKAIGGWTQKCPLLNIGVDGKQPEELGVTVEGSGVLNGLGSGTTFQKRGSPFRRFATTIECCLL